ncbi:30S ribosome-binding factor RbfA [Tropheryma whipplei]|uniref:Ribosome-binding factor A n=3 Tax=Tropheryma whipplei TaxID=2039 RepID=RBFA_TROWT|nr:30S ribosome-binding factor RbfA [Tropheryma whipplei]Q83N20.1 RecName: Full=Ribosome-binding factor A [Tropheryma whipplei str. Twist]Q83ND3.1 RecName: Full=Ribosome-binding factor A [Tropheryma whipplei TW08/27]AAO44256.1 ribosome-binding factor A [Tropheryma whipplei str. Twist]CAD67277.1 ribosome-binding factor A [Tropheryma whipplei TW08/27]
MDRVKEFAMKDQIRAHRMAGRIRHLISRQIETKLRDQLGLVTITEVQVTGDLHHAKVFVTVYGTKDEAQTALKILEDNRANFRRSLGVLKVRFVPTVEFELDRLFEDAGIMDELIQRARESDKRIAAGASGPIDNDATALMDKVVDQEARNPDSWHTAPTSSSHTAGLCLVRASSPIACNIDSTTLCKPRTPGPGL